MNNFTSNVFWFMVVKTFDSPKQINGYTQEGEIRRKNPQATNMRVLINTVNLKNLNKNGIAP